MQSPCRQWHIKCVYMRDATGRHKSLSEARIDSFRPAVVDVVNTRFYIKYCQTAFNKSAYYILFADIQRFLYIIFHVKTYERVETQISKPRVLLDTIYYCT